ncbi:MAG: hypothetical protein CL624_05755 [Arcobacter sp.]|nr:hypothetical protein [Arcobacter sp.]|tara:strand:+ start:1475 stop:1996 length:522 start_codon:yes stop_codon:yes gene_type:complete
MEERVVKDFSRGMKHFGMPMLFLFPILLFFSNAEGHFTDSTINTIIVSSLVFFLTLSIKGFLVNYKPLIVTNNIVSIPASDQIRTFTDFIIVNEITGLYRRRKYSVDSIENVANGYTKPGNSKNRKWNVVITGIQKGKSFSQRIDCSNKQVRDEVRNTLKQTISGKVNSDFAI